MVHSDENILIVMPKFGGVGQDLLANTAYPVDILEYDEYKLVKKNVVLRVVYGLLSLVALIFSSNRRFLKLIGPLNFASKNFDLVNGYVGRELEKRCAKKYSSIIWIKCDGISDKVLNSAQVLWRVPHILYLYDPVIRYPSILTKFHKFDFIYTFDPQEAVDYDLRYLPLFKRPISNLERGNPTIIDFCISFVGEFSWHRFARLCHFGYYLKHDFKFVLVSKWLPSFRFMGVELCSKRLNMTDIHDIYRRSACLLELGHPGQSGRTQRVDDGQSHNLGLVFLEVNVADEHRNAPSITSIEFIQLLKIQGGNLEMVRSTVRNLQCVNGDDKSVSVESFLQMVMDK